MTREIIVELLNNSINNKSSNVKELLEMVENYLTDINFDRKKEMIQLIVNTPPLLPQAIKSVFDYYIYKYSINYIIHNNNIIKYY